VRMIVPFQRLQLPQLALVIPDTTIRHWAGAAAQAEHPVMPVGQQGVVGNMNHARGATNGCQSGESDESGSVVDIETVPFKALPLIRRNAQPTRSAYLEVAHFSTSIQVSRAA